MCTMKVIRTTDTGIHRYADLMIIIELVLWKGNTKVIMYVCTWLHTYLRTHILTHTHTHTHTHVHV